MSSSWTFIPEISGAFDSFTARLRKIILLCGALCLALFVSACGDSMTPHGGPSPPANAAAASGSTTQTTLAPLLPPAGLDERPLAPGSLGRPIAADGLPALQPVKGVNVSIDTLFSEDIKDPIERARRLETAVVEMRRDLDATMPAIKRLVAIEKDIQLLSSQLGTLLNGEPAPPADNTNEFSSAPLDLTPPVQEEIEIAVPAPQAETGTPVAALGPAPPAPSPPRVAEAPIIVPPPAAAPEAPPAPAPAPPAMTSPAATSPAKLAVLGLRLGEHTDKTRLVFDMTGAAVFRTDLDNDEKILVVEIEKAGWSGKSSETLSSPLIQSYTTQPIADGGTRIILTLKKKTVIASENLLSPEPPSNNHRLVIDLSHE